MHRAHCSRPQAQGRSSHLLGSAASEDNSSIYWIWLAMRIPRRNRAQGALCRLSRWFVSGDATGERRPGRPQNLVFQAVRWRKPKGRGFSCTRMAAYRAGPGFDDPGFAPNRHLGTGPAARLARSRRPESPRSSEWRVLHAGDSPGYVEAALQRSGCWRCALFGVAVRADGQIYAPRRPR
jgi:hypothetical protein